PFETGPVPSTPARGYSDFARDGGLYRGTTSESLPATAQSRAKPFRKHLGHRTARPGCSGFGPPPRELFRPPIRGITCVESAAILPSTASPSQITPGFEIRIPDC